MPIPCALSLAELPGRRAMIDALAADGLLDRTLTPAGVRVRLRDTPDIYRRTRELIAAESRCCAFLRFGLGRADGALVLEVSGPADARPLIEQFFAGDATAATSRPA